MQAILRVQADIVRKLGIILCYCQQNAVKFYRLIAFVHLSQLTSIGWIEFLIQGLRGYFRVPGFDKIYYGIRVNVHGVRRLNCTREAGFALIWARMRIGKEIIFGIAMK